MFDDSDLEAQTGVKKEQVTGEEVKFGADRDDSATKATESFAPTSGTGESQVDSGGKDDSEERLQLTK